MNGVAAPTLASRLLHAGSDRPALVVHTARAVRPCLAAIAAVVALAVIGAVTAGTLDVAIPSSLAQLVTAALAVSVATPHDPAANLIAAMPTGQASRLAYRAAVLVAGAIAGWVLGGWLIEAVAALPPSEAFGAELPALAALAAVGIAAGRWWGAWGACAPLVIVSAGDLVAGQHPFAEVLELWSTRPWPTLAAGLIATAGHLIRHP